MYILILFFEILGNHGLKGFKAFQGVIIHKTIMNSIYQLDLKCFLDPFRKNIAGNFILDED
jgi:hypothetical protein